MPVSRTRLASERAREREVCSYYPLSWDIPDLTSSLTSRFDGPDGAADRFPPFGHVPRACPDPVLTAFAQLGALRLGAARSLISLIDSQSQLILSEATGTLSLRSHLTNDEREALWLGNCIIPRACGLCEGVLDSPGDPAVIINDLQLDGRTATRPYVQSTPNLRFYAGVPLKSPKGAIIGAYCIYDDAPRSGLDDSQVMFLQDVADAVVLYLGSSRAHAFNRKAERMVRGLTSFVTGAADLQDTTELDEPHIPGNPATASPLPSRASVSSTDPHQATGGPSTPSSESQDREQEDETIALQNRILPPGAKQMFSRAANIMRESSNLQGVIFFDASMANSIPSEGNTPTSSNNGSDTEASTVSFTAADSSSGSTASSSSTDPQAKCKILGFADAGRSSRDGRSPRRDYLGLTELSLKRLLTRHPHGKVFNIVRARTDDVPVKRTKRGNMKRCTAVDAIVDVAHTARSAAIIPLWDYDRQRWFAGCLCWISEPNRVLSHGSDLLYLRAFGHSIMAELSRIDATAVDQAKTTFIESVSHELRSPLHGILGGVEYLQGMQLDAFQINIVNSIAMCGRTLLDTVQSVLEYSKINEFTGPYSKNATSSYMRLRRSSMDSSGTTPTVNIRQLTEETAEAVFAGQSYNILSSRSDSGDDYFDLPNPSSPGSEGPVRKSVRVILDLPVRPCWTFAMQSGIWRHIVMNVFGNALRYTHEGFVRVALSAVDVSDSESEVTLTVSDSGIGMSTKYLQEGLFTPFTQENPFSAGTGLGMSIVRRLVQSIGGMVSVESKPHVGTTVTIRVTLSKRAPQTNYVESDVAKQIGNWKIAVVRESLFPDGEAQGICYTSERQFHDSLSATLEDWFDIKITNLDEVGEDSSQLIIYPGPSFDSMFRTRSRQGVSVVVALDAFEAATLRADLRVTSGLIQVVTQPCGPMKLARVLERYLSRLDAQFTAPIRPDIVRSRNSIPGLLFRPKVSSEFGDTPTPKPDSNLEALPRPPSPPQQPRNPITHIQTATTSASSSSSTSIHTPSSSHSPFPFPNCQQQDEHGPGPMPPPSAAASEPGSEILVVDDNPLNLRLLSAFLSKHSLPHTTAVNGLDALNLFKANPRRWAAVLMDLSMPVMDGVTATREIRSWEMKLTNPPVRSDTPGKGELQRNESSNSAETLTEERRQSKDTGAAEAPQEAPDEASPRGLHSSNSQEGEHNPSSGASETSSTFSPIVSPTEEWRDYPLESPARTKEVTAATSEPTRPLQQLSPRSPSSGVQIIVITGLGSATARFEAMSAGADVFMTKPIKFRMLMKMLKGSMVG